MAGAMTSTAIEEHLRSREELAGLVAVLRLDRAAEAVKAWHEFWTDRPAEGEDLRRQEGLLERFERVTGRPLAAACPTGCTCRGQETARPS
jgi:hypothetical protein